MAEAARRGLEGQGAIKKPDGGYRFLTVTDLAAAWSCYREGVISARALRAYFAAHEVAARRCELKPRRVARYSRVEVAGLLGRMSPGKVRDALTELRRVGLVRLSDGELAFGKPCISSAAEERTRHVLAEFKNPDRAVPVPRRVLRLLAKRSGRGFVATTLGHVLRCNRFVRGRGCVTSGLCHPRWIADLFGVSLAAVKAARAELEREGVLLRDDTPLWVRRRYGSRVEVNPVWGTLPEETSQELPPPKSSSSAPQVPPKSGLSESELEPSSTYKHQKPATRRPPGIFGKPPNPQEPNLRNVIEADLRDVGRLEKLFREAARRGVVPETESGFYDFVALAERAKRVGRNPCALFAKLVRAGRFDFVTNADEDAALRRVRANRDPDRGRRPRERYSDPEAERKAVLRRQFEELLRRDPSLRAS
jgi:hypothetical protein